MALGSSGLVVLWAGARGKTDYSGKSSVWQAWTQVAKEEQNVDPPPLPQRSGKGSG